MSSKVVGSRVKLAGVLELAETRRRVLSGLRGVAAFKRGLESKSSNHLIWHIPDKWPTTSSGADSKRYCAKRMFSMRSSSKRSAFSLGGDDEYLALER